MDLPVSRSPKRIPMRVHSSIKDYPKLQQSSGLMGMLGMLGQLSGCNRRFPDLTHFLAVLQPDAALVNGMATGHYPLPAASMPQQRRPNAGALIDQRVGSLDYLLKAAPAAPSGGTSQLQAPALHLPPLNGHPGSRPATPNPKPYRPAVGDRRGSAGSATVTSGVTFQRVGPHCDPKP